MPKKEGEPEANRRSGKRITDIFMWLQCFGVHMSIWGAQSSRLILELMAYMSLIIKDSREYAGMAWWNYDVLFRRHAALKQNTKWSVINTTLYARCFTGAPKNPRSVRHARPPRMRRETAISGCFQSPPLNPGSPPPPRGGICYSGEVCQKWNKEECSFSYCRHTHVCSVCGEYTQKPTDLTAVICNQASLQRLISGVGTLLGGSSRRGPREAELSGTSDIIDISYS